MGKQADGLLGREATWVASQPISAEKLKLGGAPVIECSSETKQQVEHARISLKNVQKTNATKIANFFASAKTRIAGFIDGLANLGNENIVAVPA